MVQTKLESKVMDRSAFIFRAVLLLGTLVSSALAADAPLPPISCGNGMIGGINCVPSRKDLKESRQAFERGVKLHNHDRLEEALVQFEQAARLNPQSTQFLTAREAVKAKLVFDHLQRGNVLLLEDARIRAAAEFRAALDLDSENQYAQERLAEAAQSSVLADPLRSESLNSSEIHLMPENGRATFH